MKLCIAEKRDVAKEIARVVGASEDKKDWFEGCGFAIAWCQGHLLELRTPLADGKWDLSALPIMPDEFELAPISEGKDKDGKYIESAGCRHRLSVIRTLMKECDEVICCTDAAKEGQLIFENVYRYLGIRRPVKRLWISSLSTRAIKDGFANLMDNAEFEDLGYAARMRAEGDWLIGINATRAFTLTAGASKPLSLGRVQTPTLCMICQRYVENKEFKSEPFWYLSGESAKKSVPFKYRSNEKYTQESDAREIYDAAMRSGYLTVESVETERKNEDPPLLHDLASLQKLANSKYGLTAKQTLDAAQSLYQKQILSYPRTGSRFIPEDVFQEIPEILRTLTGHPVYGEHAQRLIASPLNRRSVNETKITDHHGLILTGTEPFDLSVMESQVYELVLIRFLEAFSPVCVADVTTVEFSSGGALFNAKGRMEISLGWRGVCKDEKGGDVQIDEVDDVEMTMRPLPQMEEGEQIPIGQLEVIRDETKPKPLLTEATLLSCMENAGRRIDDKAMAKVMKGVGIGTAATRDSVIEEIIKRGYVFREKKKLVPTELGLSVYNVIKDKEIADVELTAKWEMSMKEIADGNKDERDVFLSGIRNYTIEITDDIRTSDDIRALAGLAGPLVIKCPQCGAEVRLGEKGGIRCACGFGIWRDISGRRLTDEQMKQLYHGRKTEVIEGFKSKAGKSFSAMLVLVDGKLEFRFPESDPENIPACPKCGKPMRFSEKSLWCPECRFVVWREVCHKALSDKQLTILVKKGRVGPIAGFVSKAGKRFEAELVLTDEGKVQFDFQNKK